MGRYKNGKAIDSGSSPRGYEHIRPLH